MQQPLKYLTINLNLQVINSLGPILLKASWIYHLSKV